MRLSRETGEFNASATSEMFIFHNGGVQILCKYPDTVQQFKMQLLKGNNILCDLTKTKGSGDKVSITNLNVCQFQLSNNSVSFFLYNLDSSHASYYICKLSIFDPPPFQVDILSKEYLNIYESQVCCQLKFWLPIGCAAFVVVCIFGCVLTCWLTKKVSRASLVAQWWGVNLPVQGTWVCVPVREDPTCRGAAAPVGRGRWACVSGACAPQRERPQQ
ncbi:inducible T-cell costimulator isoform X1 [Monodon monoceros]|uniref:Inducible T-cell costimulator n=1 Tax=Monodon monoceros TaxID=40151 RepID=A0A8C6B222_MONMO|nr:inducible T-cell costimulator isoform X1 [Monodon monoceros]